MRQLPLSLAQHVCIFSSPATVTRALSPAKWCGGTCISNIATAGGCRRHHTWRQVQLGDLTTEDAIITAVEKTCGAHGQPVPFRGAYLLEEVRCTFSLS